MEAPSTWWQTFFSGMMVETLPYWSTEERTRQETDFLVETLAPASGARIADVPCGIGRLTLELAARGFAATGVDFTPSYIEQARGKASERGLKVTFEQRDMRDLPWAGEFDHAFCFGNSFAYFDDTGNREFLQAVHRILKPGGKFVLQTGLAAESILAHPLQRRWYTLGDIYFLHETQYDSTAGQLTSGYTLLRNGQSEKKHAVYRIYTHRQLLELLSDSGFVTHESFGTLTREPFQLGSHELFLVAEKT